MALNLLANVYPG